MTIEDLKAIAQKVMDHGIKCIRDDGELHQMFHLIGRDGAREIIVCDGPLTNSEEAKQMLSERLKRRVRERGIEAVAIVSDSYIAEMTPELEKVKQAFRMTVEDCWKVGMIPKREAVSVALESPIYQQVARQEYRRVIPDASGGRTIELVGAPDILSSVPDANGLSGKYSGRMMGFFASTREGHA